MPMLNQKSGPRVYKYNWFYFSLIRLVQIRLFEVVQHATQLTSSARFLKQRLQLRF